MVKIFSYIQEMDCFAVDAAYKKLADLPGLTEWNEVVWIGRFFLMNNDAGEHWFDNPEERELKEAKEMGYDTAALFVLAPDRFKNDYDGPCHTPEERILFWRDVLMSLHLTYETLFSEAKKINEERKRFDVEDFIADLEERIAEIATCYINKIISN